MSEEVEVEEVDEEKSTEQKSTNYGYTSGGAPQVNEITKFSFSSDGNSTDVGNLTVTKQYSAGASF